MKHKILFISRDPGGTNQLVALRDILMGQRCDNRTNLFARLDLSATPDVTVIAKDFANIIWQQNDIAVEVWPNIESEADIALYLAGFNPDQIITSTCHVDDRTEQVVWRMARQLGIKTTAFLDSSLNTGLRFKDDLGQTVLPDRVSLIDEKAAASLQSLGLVADAIFMSGDLYRAYVRAKAKEKGNVTARLRSDWGGKDGEYLILFASDYIREMQAMGVDFEITEFDCLACLLDLLNSGDIAKYLENSRPPYRLVIRPHPKDTPGKYDDYPRRGMENLTILIDGNGASTDAVLSADIVAGLGSSLLNEARALGGDVLELGPIVVSRRDHKRTVS